MKKSQLFRGLLAGLTSALFVMSPAAFAAEPVKEHQLGPGTFNTGTRHWTIPPVSRQWGIPRRSAHWTIPPITRQWENPQRPMSWTIPRSANSVAKPD